MSKEIRKNFYSKSGQIYNTSMLPLDAIIGPWSSTSEFETWVSDYGVTVDNIPEYTHIQVAEENAVKDYYRIKGAWIYDKAGLYNSLLEVRGYITTHTKEFEKHIEEYKELKEQVNKDINDLTDHINGSTGDNNTIFNSMAAALMIKVLKGIDFGTNTEAINAANDLILMFGGTIDDKNETPEPSPNPPVLDPDINDPSNSDEELVGERMELDPLTTLSFFFENTNTASWLLYNNISDNVADKIDSIRTQRNAIKAKGHTCFEFMFFTDPHIRLTDTEFKPIKYTAMLARYIKEQLGWVPTLFGGDLSGKVSTEDKVPTETRRRHAELFIKLFDYDVFSTLGNHDIDINNNLIEGQTAEEILDACNILINCNNNAYKDANGNRMNTHYTGVGNWEAGYFDVPEAKIRVVQFNYQLGSFWKRFGDADANIAKANEYLDSMPSGYKAILLTHGITATTATTSVEKQYSFPFSGNIHMDNVLLTVSGHGHGFANWVKKFGNRYIPMFMYGATSSGYDGDTDTKRRTMMCYFQIDIEGEQLYRYALGYESEQAMQSYRSDGNLYCGRVSSSHPEWTSSYPKGYLNPLNLNQSFLGDSDVCPLYIDPSKPIKN